MRRPPLANTRICFLGVLHSLRVPLEDESRTIWENREGTFMPAASLHRLSSRPGRTWLSLSVLILGVMGLSRPAFSQLPVQTYFVPLPEDVLLTDTFRGINSSVTGPVNSLISVAIAADNTIIWYDPCAIR